MPFLLSAKLALRIVAWGAVFASACGLESTRIAHAFTYPSDAPTSVAAQDTAYAIPEGAYFASPLGLDSNAGTLGSPWSLAKGIAATPEGGTLVLREGDYRMTATLTVRRRMTIQAYPREKPWLRGDLVVSNWTAEAGGRWSIPSAPSGGPTFEWPRPASIDSNYTSATNPLAGEREIVFFGGTPLVQVATLAEVNAGTFYVNRTDHKLYIGKNPTGVTVEVTAAAQALSVLKSTNDAVDGTRIRGLNFTRFADWGLTLGATGVEMEGCTSVWNGQSGVEINGQSQRALDMVIRNNTFISNGRKGLSANNAGRMIIEGNTFSHNNVERFTTFWDAGGLKVIRMRDLMVRDNIVLDNYCSGIWMDISCIDGKIARNFVRYTSTSGIVNGSAGIFWEISHRGTIAGNVVAGYGTGILVSTNTETRVYNNTLIRNNVGIIVKDDGRLNQPTIDNGVAGGGGLPDGDPFESGENADEAALGATWGSRNNIVKNNLMWNNASGKTALFDGGQTARGEASIVGISAMNHNAYYRQNSGLPTTLIKWRFSSSNAANYANLAAFKAGVAAFETNGYGTDGGTEPFFVNESNGDYHLRAYAGNPAAGKGETLPDDIAALLGRAASPVSIGAFETAATPAIPTNLTATAKTPERIDLAWNDASSGESGFQVERSLDGTTFTEIGVAGPNQRTYQDQPLAPGTIYTYRVRAFDVLGASAPSNLASATTASVPAPVTIAVLADAHVMDADGGRASTVNKNYGTEPTLLVKNNNDTNLNRDSYLKFDLSSVSRIGKAKLRVHASVTQASTATTQLYGVANTSWVESGAGGITWANRPPLTSPNSVPNPLRNCTMTGSALAMYDIDVTRYLQTEKAAGRNLVTLAFHNVASFYAIIGINSKEATANPPVLVVTPLPAGNIAPVAGDDAYAPAEDQNFTLAAPGVLSNDSDADGASQGTQMSVSLVSGASQGTLQLRPNGSFDYKPRTNFSGTDSFSYTVSDGLNTSEPATVTLSSFAVNDAPVVDLNGTTLSGLFSFQTSFVAGHGPVPIAHSTATITDLDSPNLTSLSATISNLQNGASEILAATLSGGLTQNYNATTGTLSISGSAGLATYHSALRSITYGNSAASPNLTSRIIHVAASDGALSSQIAVATIQIRPATLPNPWLSDDIGYTGSQGDNLGLAGSASFTAPGTFTVSGAGSGIPSDIAGVNDGMHFVYQPLSGDGQIVARLASMTNTNAQAKAGVMMRETLSIASRNAFMGLSPSSGAFFQARTGVGSTTTISNPTGISAPRWIKLTRSANTISGYISSDGVSWTFIDSDSVPMTGVILVGFGVSSRNLSQLNTAVFDNVSVAAPVENAPAPEISPSGGAFNDSVTVSLSSLPNSQIYYTLDGSAPSNASTLYTAPFTLTSTQTVSAISYRESFLPSAVASATFTANPAATLSVGAAQVLEGSRGTVSLVFPLALSRAVAFDVTANGSTSGGTATANTDYLAATNASVTIPAGQTAGSISIAVKGDMSVEPDETLILTLSNPVNAVLAAASATGTITNDDSPVAGTSGAIISEFRFRGTGGAGDEFIEIFNTLPAPLNVSGWRIRYRTASGLQNSIISDGIVIPARGHFLFTGSAYSLGNYGASDQSLAGDVLDTSGVALFNAQSGQQDAVGFAASELALREGNGLPNSPTANAESAFVRAYDGPFPQNTVADSSGDFIFVATTAAAVAGAPGNLTPQLGAPSPEGLASPVYANHEISTAILDPKVLQTSPPNRVRVGGLNTGTLLVRRTLTNNSGRTISRIRLHVTRITSQNSPLVPGNTAATQADVRLSSSAEEASVATSNGNVRVYSTRLESPSAPNGGALGATQDFDVSLLKPLLPGASHSYSFLLTVEKSGNFLVVFNFEAL